MSIESIKRTSTVFLKAVIILIGIGTFAFLLWEPNVEGANANATTLYEVYFDDPFLAFAYVASIPFFIGLYQAFTLVGYAERNEVFTQRSLKALRMIRHCAMVTVVFIVVGVGWLVSEESDDRPPIIVMGIVTTLASVAVASAAGVSERFVQNAIDIKSENDLTV